MGLMDMAGRTQARLGSLIKILRNSSCLQCTMGLKGSLWDRSRRTLCRRRDTRFSTFHHRCIRIRCSRYSSSKARPSSATPSSTMLLPPMLLSNLQRRRRRHRHRVEAGECLRWRRDNGKGTLTWNKSSSRTRRGPVSSRIMIRLGDTKCNDTLHKIRYNHHLRLLLARRRLVGTGVLGLSRYQRPTSGRRCPAVLALGRAISMAAHDLGAVDFSGTFG